MRLLWLWWLLFPIVDTLAQTGAPNLNSGTPTASIGLKLQAMDAYIFRGRILDPETAYQGELTIGIASWSYNVLYHHDDDDLNLFEETTHSMEYTMLFGNSVSTLGYRFYDYGDSSLPDTQEFFFRTLHQNRWHPSYGLAYDIDAYRGIYVDASLSRLFRLTRHLGFSLTLDGGIAYDLNEKSTRQGDIMEYGFYEDDGISHAGIRTGLHWTLSERFSIEGYYEFHRAFDDRLKEDPLTGEENQLWRTALRITLP